MNRFSQHMPSWTTSVSCQQMFAVDSAMHSLYLPSHPDYLCVCGFYTYVSLEPAPLNVNLEMTDTLKYTCP